MRRANIGCSRVWALVALALVGMGSARGQDAVATVQPATSLPPVVVVGSSGETWRAVNDQRLDAMRGGFDLGRGLLASFGIERVVYINGNLVSNISVNIPDVARMTTAQASALASAVGTVNVIQNGPGNTFDPATMNRTVAATVIQNTLDAQHIQSLTTINTSVNTLDEFRSINFNNSLQSALIQSLGH